mmetsp:Transcript_21726/g.53660  ORF Transcript_21726/g.53660 Transcript_21726/m.53660 type:complete len:286 (-) Transcript_21726:128-985(-)
MPENRPTGCCASYIYETCADALAACQTKGLGLCSKQQIMGYEHCSYGWLTDGAGLWMGQLQQYCGPIGYHEEPGLHSSRGAYCCVEPDPTPAPTSTPSALPTPMPSSPPSFEPMQGDHLQNEHYVIYDGNSHSTREEAESTCAAKGLTLCSTSAITNFELCAGGWLSDGAGWWMNTAVNPGVCGGIGFHTALWLPLGAYCCGRPYYMPEDRLSYPYWSREEGLAACQSKGMQLCSKDQIMGFELCSYGWLTDGAGLWMDTLQPGCGPIGYHDTIFPYNGAYCCAV